MSTFNGIVAEFPDIRVDFFRRHPDHRAPLACFLSHIHSDHLAGLEILKSPFVYCSAATREMLLQLERYPCRINFARGILEARKQTYKHLKNILKPIPLETPTDLELEPDSHIRVTLFDANHCPGAVMFLFEDDQKAVLYTGDTRSEPWFVNSLVRSPALIEYTCGIKTLDKIYLDTSFTDDVDFQTKAEGLRELLETVSQYPKDTIFHFQAWTFGYEDVWVALSKRLDSKIHVDQYKMRLYGALSVKVSVSRYGSQMHSAPEAPSLVGFMCGNTQHSGCLTKDNTVRLHSCEKGNYCSTVREGPVVWIQPIIARLPNGVTISEIGVGGGGDDLEREAELDFYSLEDIQALFQIILEDESLSEDMKKKVQAFLPNAATHGRNVSLDLDIATFGEELEAEVVDAIKSIATKSQVGRGRTETDTVQPREDLPKRITFPYSRHSSYPELCKLVQAFTPKDIWPCTVDPAEWLEKGVSIRNLFGDFCSGAIFDHDVKMDSLSEKVRPSRNANNDSQRTDSNTSEAQGDRSQDAHGIAAGPPLEDDRSVAREMNSSSAAQNTKPDHSDLLGRKRNFQQYSATGETPLSDDEDVHLLDSQASVLSAQALAIRRQAFNTMIENARDLGWQPLGLLSTSDHHHDPEVELGET